MVGLTTYNLQWLWLVRFWLQCVVLYPQSWLYRVYTSVLAQDLLNVIIELSKQDKLSDTVLANNSM